MAKFYRAAIAAELARDRRTSPDRSTARARVIGQVLHFFDPCRPNLQKRSRRKDGALVAIKIRESGVRAATIRREIERRGWISMSVIGDARAKGRALHALGLSPVAVRAVLANAGDPYRLAEWLTSKPAILMAEPVVRTLMVRAQIEEASHVVGTWPWPSRWTSEIYRALQA